MNRRTFLRLAPCAAIALSNRFAFADNGLDRVRHHQPKMSYLDNGVIRLGVDLNLGGAITYLSRSGTEQNLVNSHDFGRQIQMSYYSGPVPFTVPGKQPKPEWKNLGWNPSQVGDAFGNPSRVLAHTNNGKQLYVKCVPMQWPLEDVPGDCTFECWFELDGAAVRARCRLTNNRSDHTQYPARGQELPAVYTNGPWYKLMTYIGDKPFTGDALARIRKTDKGLWTPWIATECWAALVDDNDFGLGIFEPGCGAFNGGFFDKPHKGGPRDNPTGYIAPTPNEIIDWNIVHEYRYDLIVGTLSQIRDYVYTHAKPLSPPAWRFEKDRQGWTYVNADDTGWPIRGELNVRLDQNDPQLHGPVQFWSDAGTVMIEAASHTHANDARIFWRKLTDSSFTEGNSIPFELT